MSAQRREFVEAEKQAGGNVVKACDLLQVSRSAFYQWRRQVPSARQVSDAELTEKTGEINAASAGPYGAPRGHDDLRHLLGLAGRGDRAGLPPGGRLGPR